MQILKMIILPSTNQKMFVPYDGDGYYGGNTYSNSYFLDESYGGAILYGYARGSRIKMEIQLQWIMNFI